LRSCVAAAEFNNLLACCFLSFSFCVITAVTPLARKAADFRKFCDYYRSDSSKQQIVSKTVMSLALESPVFMTDNVRSHSQRHISPELRKEGE